MIIYLKSHDKAIPSGIIEWNVRHVVTKALKMTACLGRRENKAGRDLGVERWRKSRRENAFHSTKTFEKLEISGNCWIPEMRTIQPKFLEIPEAKLNGKKTCGKNFSKIIPREVVLFFGNFGKCCSIRYCNLPKIQTGRFGQKESAERLRRFLSPQARRISFRISFYHLCTLLSWNLEQAIKMIVSVSGASYSCISVFSVWWRLLHSCHSTKRLFVFVRLQFKRFLVDSPLQVNMFSLGHFTQVLC